MGSTGLTELARDLDCLVGDDLQFIVAAGGEGAVDRRGLPKHVHVERFVNADLVLPHCDLMVCHGGNGTVYQALSHGVPLVGAPAHAEQAYSLKRAREHGVGVALSPRRVRRTGLADVPKAIRRVLGDERFRQRAQAFAAILANYDGRTLAADHIERFARERRPQVQRADRAA
jgi:UDP:flavonoid glycosyltransferase YjiC (YdhE family)